MDGQYEHPEPPEPLVDIEEYWSMDLSDVTRGREVVEYDDDAYPYQHEHNEYDY